MAQWLHVLAALAGGTNGWRAPQPVMEPCRKRTSLP
jgi:hypothetical protein